MMMCLLASSRSSHVACRKTHVLRAIVIASDWTLSIHLYASQHLAMFCAQIVTSAYEAKFQTELTLYAGEEVTVDKQPAGGWWHGAMDRRSGWFPCNHVAAKGGSAIVTARSRESCVIPSSHPTDDDMEIVGVYVRRVYHDFGPSRLCKLSLPPSAALTPVPTCHTGSCI